LGSGPKPPIPNPQSPIPNPQSPIMNKKNNIFKLKNYKKLSQYSIKYLIIN
jgi:hypothetical protein